MNTDIAIPGKVVLTGEYAVLHGAPAVVAPVSRFLHLQPSVRGVKDAVKALPYMARKAWEILREEYPDLEPDVVPDITNDEMVMRLNGVMTKLGLGSSAAEAVGVYRWWVQHSKAKIAKLRAKGVRGLPEEWQAVWKLLKKIQNGIGSGLEIPAMWSNEAGAFTLGPKGPSWQNSDRILDKEMEMRLIFLNRSQDTREALAKFKTLEQQEPERFGRWLQSARKVAGGASEAWRQSLSKEFMQRAADYRQVIRELADLIGIPLEPPGFDGLVRRVKDLSGVLKTTGAGGGDCAVAFFKRPGPTAEELTAAIVAEGFSVVG